MPCKRISLSIAARWETWRGFSCRDFLREKDSTSGFLFLDPEVIKILSMEAIWNFDKGTGLSRADIRLWGTKGPSIKPRCIGNARGQTQWKSITHSEHVFLAVVISIQRACVILRCHLWSVRLYRIFLHYLIKGTIVWREKKIEHKTCVLIFSTTFVCNISHSNKKWTRIYYNRTSVCM